MPFTEHQGVRIHYRMEGSGPTILMVHGHTNSAQGWYDGGYVAALAPTYRLVMPDLPGHGQSDRPHDLAPYGRERLVGAMLAALDAAGGGRAIYWGYSQGTMIGFGTALLAAERFDAWVLGGMHPYGPTDGRKNARVEPLRQGMEAYIAWMEAQQGPFAPERRARMLAADAQALASCAEATDAYRHQPEALAKLTAPALFYCGTADGLFEGAQRAAAAVPGTRFVALPGLNHGQASARGDMILPAVVPFLAEVTAAHVAIPSPLMGEG